MFLSPAAWHRVLRLLLIAVSAVYLLTVLGIALARIAYPYELEWMETGSLAMARRVAEGLPLYTAPTVDWTPFIYPPLLYWLAAALGAVLGDGFLPLRLVSLLATLGSFTLIGVLVRRRTGGWLWPLAGAALFAGCYELCGGWMDVGRVDPLFVALALAAVVAIDGNGVRGHALGGGLFVLAFLAKQSALVLLLPIVAWALLTQKDRLRWMLPAVALGGIALVWSVLHAATGGWYTYYIYTLPAAHEIAPSQFIEFWRFDIARPLPFATLALIALILPSPWERGERLRWLAFAAAFVGSAWISRLHTGGWHNVVLPAYALLAPLLAVSAGRIHGQAGPLTRLVVLAALVLQFGLLIFDPRDHLPDPATRAATDALVDRLAQAPDEIWIPHHPGLAVAAGKAGSAHSMAIEDVMRADIDGGRRALLDVIEARMRAGYWDLIVLDTDHFRESLAARYRRAGAAYPDTSLGWPVTGARLRPEHVFERIGESRSR